MIMQPIVLYVQLKNSEIFYYSSINNHLKLTKIGKITKEVGFGAIKATVNQFSHFFVTAK